MKKVVTRDYYIELGELREIIAKYFKEKTGETVALCNIDVDVRYKDGGFAEFAAVHINIQQEDR
jgi:hypothetical protein